MLRVVIISLIVLLVVPFSSASENVVSQSDNNVVIQLKWKHQFQFAGYYAAKEQGFYAEEGINVSLSERNPAKGHIQSVVEGDAHYGVADAGLLYERMQGAPVVLLKQIFQHSPLVLVTKKSSGISNPFQLRGKAIMFDSEGHSSAPIIALLHNTLGDMQKVKTVKQSFGLDDLIFDKIDALSVYITNQPYVLNQQGIEINVIDPRSFGIDIYGDNFFTTEQEIKNYPQRVQAMVRATLRGWQYALAHPDEIIQLIREKYDHNLSYDQLKYEANLTAKMLDADKVPLGSVVPARYDDVARIYKAAGMVKSENYSKNLFYGVDSGLFVENETLTLTQQEKVWLAENKTLRIAPDPDFPPMEFFDVQGNYQGLVADYMQLVTERLGLKLEVIRKQTWLEAIDALRTKEVDVIGANVPTADYNAEFIFTEPYFSFSDVVVTHDGIDTEVKLDHLKGKKVLVVKGWPEAQILKNQYPEIEAIEVDTTLAGLNKVALKEYDYLFTYLPTALYLIREHTISGVRVAGFSDVPADGAIMLHKDAQVLPGLLQKALNSVTEQEKLSIEQRWMSALPTLTPSTQTNRDLELLINNLKLYDEILTESVRNYAYTQNEKWLLRYQDYQPKLDEEIEKFRADYLIADSPEFIRFNVANNKLYALEEDIIKAVNQGNNDIAIAIVEGNAYLRAKEIYVQVLEDKLGINANYLTELRLGLTQAERDWLQQHPVIEFVGDTSVPPYRMTKIGVSEGITPDIINAIANQLGIEVKQRYLAGFEYVELLRNGNSMISGIWPESFVAQFDPYQPSQRVIQAYSAIYGRNGGEHITDLKLVTGKTIAVPRGGHAYMVNQLAKNNTIVSTESITESINLVLNQQADFFMAYRAAAHYTLGQFSVTDIKELYVNPIQDHGVLMVNKQHPLLLSIVNKALDKVIENDLPNILTKWTGQASETSSPAAEPSLTDDWRNLFALALLLMAIVGGTLLLFRLLDHSKKDPLSYQFSSAKNMRVAVLFNAVLIVVAVGFALWSLKNIKENVKQDAADSLQTVLQSTMEAMNIWVKNKNNKVNILAADPRLVEHTSQLLAAYKQGANLVTSQSQIQLRQLFKDVQRQSKNLGFLVIATDGTNISAMRDELLGRANLIQKYRPDLLSRALNGETLIIPPIPADTQITNTALTAGSKQFSTMFFAAPIKNNSGDVVAVLAERFDPRHEFSRINFLGRIGDTGETYSFNHHGQLLSESRFKDHLLKAGLIQQNEQSALSVRVSDPGGNLTEGYQASLSQTEQPLTKMATSATSGESSYDVDGYRDYRGVFVIGAWSWDNTLGFGMTTEIDVAEAMEAYYRARTSIIIILLITLPVTLGFTLLTMLLGRRANSALQLAHNQLEERVKLRTRELWEANQKLEFTQFAVDHSVDSAFWLTLDGKFVFINETGAKRLGYSQQEIKGMSVHQIDSAFPEDKLSEIVEQIASGKAMVFESMHSPKHGDDYPVEITARYVEFGNDKRLIASARDITDRKQAEDKLKSAKLAAEEALRNLSAQENRYRSLVANIPGAVYRCALDEHWTMYYFSEYIEKITGYPPSDFIDNKVRSLASIIHPDDREMVTQQVNKGIESDGYFTIEYRIIDKEDRIHWINERGLAVKTSNDEVDYLDGFCMDITDKKIIEQELEETLRYLHAILDSASYAIIGTDPQGTIKLFNLASETMLQYKSEEVVDLLSPAVFHKGEEVVAQAQALSEELGRTILPGFDTFTEKAKSGLVDENEWTFVRKDGSDFPITLSISAVRDNRNQIVGYMGIANDITERKKAEQQLKLAMVKADDANKAKSIFLANMSHEIRTPMNAILGYAQILQNDSNLDQEYRTIIDTINSSGNHLLGLINDILDMSKIEAGRMELLNLDFDLFALLDDIEVMLKIRTSKKGLDLIFSRSENVPQYVFGDQGKLRQVLINLLGNAIKFTDAGVVKLNASVLETEENITLMFEIADTGEGVAEDKLDTIFLPFSQAEMGLRAGGTGLGLPISREIARLMGGDVKVESQPTIGSQFFVTVKLAPSSIERLKTQSHTKHVLRLAEGQDVPLVLIVDDNLTNRDILIRILKPLKFSIIEAENGKEAVDMFEQHLPTIVLMDVVMPVMNGIEATHEIRKLQQGKNAVVIAVTASALESEVTTIIEEGANAVVRKPVNVDELLSTIAEHAKLELIYDETSGGDSAPVQQRELTSEDIVELPEELRHKIMVATRAGKITDLRMLVDLFLQWNENKGEIFKSMVAGFKLKELQELFVKKGNN
jgi:PAS domain S-box-containing protein